MLAIVLSDRTSELGEMMNNADILFPLLLLTYTLTTFCLISLCAYYSTANINAVAVWLSGSVVGRKDEVTLRRAGLVLRWVTVLEYSLTSWYLTKPPRSTQPGRPCLLYTSDAADE